MSVCKEDIPIDIKIKLEDSAETSTCDERFESQSKMLTHRHKNCETFRCRICSKEFQSKNAVARHVKIVHENVKMFQCNNCEKKFSSAAGKNY
jgi:stress-induced morphogen